MPDIRDITEPDTFFPEPPAPWWLWPTIITVAIIILALIVILILKKPKSTKRQKNLLDQARAKLAKLRETSTTLPIHTVATRASIIIRGYLEAAFEDPALFETTEEFTLRPNALSTLPPSTREYISQHLHQLATLKYTPDQPKQPDTDASTTLIDSAESILAQIELHPPAQTPLTD